MTDRPFINKSMAELERSFEGHEEDSEFCGQLGQELSYRRSKKAHKLKKRLPAPDPGHIALEDVLPSEESRLPPSVAHADIDPKYGHSAPEAILSAWTAIEILSPATFIKPADLADGIAKNLAPISGGKLPWWDSSKRYREKKRLFYQIILGSIKMAPAIEALLDVYADSREQRQPAKGEAVLAAVLVDKDGYLAGPKPISVSSFGWGLPKALAGDLRSLGRLWASEEGELIDGTMDILDEYNEHGGPLPLTMARIMEAYAYLTETIGLDPSLVKGPSFSVCTYQWDALKEPPDTVLLHSFYLEDLKRAKNLCNPDKLAKNLKSYLGLSGPRKRLDLLNDNDAAGHILRPGNFPRASWPGQGRHRLALLQQCAVNAAANDLNNGGILAVNGPPGTGKTTLLRDIVANVVTERAVAMAAYDDPENAFKISEQKAQRADNYYRIYELDKKLRGFEILVASSNNKAVEHISMELAGRAAIADDSFIQGYFQSVSKALWPGCDTWGLISAVLGNGGNRSHFRNKFWNDDDYGMHKYLKYVCGGNPFSIDKHGKKTIPRIIANEKPPADHQAALSNWLKAKQYFLKIYSSVEKRLSDLQRIHDIGQELINCHNAIEIHKNALDDLNTQLEKNRDILHMSDIDLAEKTANYDISSKLCALAAGCKIESLSHLMPDEYSGWKQKNNFDGLLLRLKELRDMIASALAEQNKLAKALDENSEYGQWLLSKRPGIIVRIFLRRKYRAWVQRCLETDRMDKELQNALQEAMESRLKLEWDLNDCNDLIKTGHDSLRIVVLTEAKRKLDSCQADYQMALERQSRQQSILKDIEEQMLAHENDLKNKIREADNLQNELNCLASIYQGLAVDASFFKLSYHERQIAMPWLDRETSRCRQDLFEAAVGLHKSFIDAASTPIMHNLNLFMKDYCMRSLGCPESDELKANLWSTFFLVVPVVTTTFASVSNMLSGLGLEALGWLLIDEAGQALPQAAVGAMMRCRRAVVVGDPLQIEPIVTLPESLTVKICRQFNVDPSLYNAPDSSAQTLSDRATGYIGAFPTDFGAREVGVPLLVHRRCSEPMFSISNAVAYGNMMVQEKQPKTSDIIEALGPSSWISVKGTGSDKWCRKEGEAVIGLLERMRAKGCRPDVYIVTPFVDVKANLLNLVDSCRILEGWAENPQAWLEERIGTVHTVQGREAEAVIFVLGAPNPSQVGARSWAGQSPNLLNVAVTRAKEAIYVVGNKDLWEEAGVFRQLSQMIN
jgi:hypothetical protein